MATEGQIPRRKYRDANKDDIENTAPPLTADPSGEAAPPLADPMEWFDLAPKLYPMDDPRFVYPDLKIAFITTESKNGLNGLTRGVLKHYPSGKIFTLQDAYSRSEIKEAIDSLQANLDMCNWQRVEGSTTPPARDMYSGVAHEAISAAEKPGVLHEGREAAKPQILDPYSNTSVFNALIQEAHSLITQNIAEASIAVGVGLMLQAFGHTEISVSADALRNFYVRFQTKRVKQSDGSTLISIVERK